MRHFTEISTLVKTLRQSSKLHALVIQSPPGMGKSSQVEFLLNELGIVYRPLGSFSTPLALYNALCETSDATLLLDDSARLFSDPLALALLKAATWPSSGNCGERVVTWRSTAERALKPSIVFSGKLILLTNWVPVGKHSDSFLSRCLYLSIALSQSEIAQMLSEAAGNARFYEDTNLAGQVAGFLIELLPKFDSHRISLRTLQVGYELAKVNPDEWKDLLKRLLPIDSAANLVASLNQPSLRVEDQIQEFIRQTGLSRRTFYNYRKRSEEAAQIQVNAENASCTSGSVV